MHGNQLKKNPLIFAIEVIMMKRMEKDTSFWSCTGYCYTVLQIRSLSHSLYLSARCERKENKIKNINVALCTGTSSITFGPKKIK